MDILFSLPTNIKKETYFYKHGMNSSADGIKIVTTTFILKKPKYKDVTLRNCP